MVERVKCELDPSEVAAKVVITLREDELYVSRIRECAQPWKSALMPC